jgi:hypothetical protein
VRPLPDRLEHNHANRHGPAVQPRQDAVLERGQPPCADQRPGEDGRGHGERRREWRRGRPCAGERRRSGRARRGKGRDRGDDRSRDRDRPGHRPEQQSGHHAE